jgi:putative toxin-antitoxin system antitoxin component (TIGR02293 family)
VRSDSTAPPTFQWIWSSSSSISGSRPLTHNTIATHAIQEIERFVIPQRTRRHRQEKNQPLTIDESDRAVRLVRIQTVAEEAFGDAGKAAQWLRRPLAAFSGEAPLEIAQTESGARVVETVLGKIAWGAAA